MNPRCSSILESTHRYRQNRSNGRAQERIDFFFRCPRQFSLRVQWSSQSLVCIIKQILHGNGPKYEVQIWNDKHPDYRTGFALENSYMWTLYRFWGIQPNEFQVDESWQYACPQLMLGHKATFSVFLTCWIHVCNIKYGEYLANTVRCCEMISGVEYWPHQWLHLLCRCQ